MPPQEESKRVVGGGKDSKREEIAACVGGVEELGLGGKFISGGHNLGHWMNLDE